MLRRAPKGGISRFKGGQFIDGATFREQAGLAQEGMGELLSRLSDRLQFLRQVYRLNVSAHRGVASGVRPMSYETIQRQMRAAIREAYEQAFVLGKRAAGNLMSPTAEDAAAVKRVLRDEYKYLRRFAADMRSDSGVMSYDRRMDYYAAAVRELFWLGWVRADNSPSREITWVVGPTEHCIDCLTHSQESPMRMREFAERCLSRGHLPQSGSLACLGYNCQCALQDNAGSFGLKPGHARSGDRRANTPEGNRGERAGRSEGVADQAPAAQSLADASPISRADAQRVASALRVLAPEHKVTASEVSAADAVTRHASDRRSRDARAAIRMAVALGSAARQSEVWPLVLFVLWLRQHSHHTSDVR